MKFNRKVAVTLGDPSGVGPEVFLKSLESDTLRENLESILVVSDPMVIKRLSGDISHNLKLHDSNGFSDLKADSINFFSINGCHDYNLGSPNQENANYILSCIDKGIEMCINDNANLVTGPINKLQIANYDKNFNDHTSYLKTTTEADNVLMVLTNPKLTVGLLTTHLPLKEVADQVTKSNLTNAIKTFNQGLSDFFHIKKPKIAILGLNPHCGEGGKFGNEEIEIISPAINELLLQGFGVEGPFSADTAFLDNNFDGILAMYHDQALPVIKTLDFSATVNVTFGLPFLRTSVDHGTAYNISNKLIANPASMVEALKIAGYGKKI